MENIVVDLVCILCRCQNWRTLVWCRECGVATIHTIDNTAISRHFASYCSHRHYILPTADNSDLELITSAPPTMIAIQMCSEKHVKWARHKVKLVLLRLFLIVNLLQN